ncbi:MAG: 4Fe-4S ferredoxin iron-sulfur binding domain protein [Deltaproteobacteria bacterium]|nr:4Fe-4S ferredoxin iron-sulfur binding domain protein [Deltaproteobacteria bacterium]
MQLAVPDEPAVPAAVDPALLWSTLRALPMLADATDEALVSLIGTGFVTRVEAPRDSMLVPPDEIRDALCLVASGQVSIGVFERTVLDDRGRQQRDATRGEQAGTLMPPGPLARSASKNLALFSEGELFNLAAIPVSGDHEVTAAFSISRVVVVMIGVEALRVIMHSAPGVERTLVAGLALTNARLRSITGIKHEILDFYVRHGLSVAGPTVRLRQLDLCIDCKQCEDACEDRHGSRRLTLGGFELGVLDFVFSCRTCEDARCLSPCEHDAIKRDPKTGEVQIKEDRCIGCSLCALSCPYGAIDMINVAEPELDTFNPVFKARLDKTGKLAFGPGKGRKAPARRIANKCDHCAGYADQACVSACPTGSLIEIAPATLFRERAEPTGKRRKRLHVLPTSPFVDGLNIRDSGAARVKTRKLSLLLWILGLGSFLAVLVEVVLRWKWPSASVSYQLLLRDGLEPELAEMNVSFLAGSKLALTCGYLGTALMVLSMAYLLQRRFKWFRNTATNQFWLDVHLMTGIVGPLFIVLHSALRLTTWVSVPFWSMTAVVVSGVIGRYLYTLVPSLTSKHELEILAQRRAITELAAEYPSCAAYASEIMERESQRSERSWEVGLLTLLPWVILDDVRRGWSRRRDRRALRRLAPRRLARAMARRIDRVVFYERRNQLAPRSKALLKAWKRIHIPFSVVLLGTMLVHIGIALELM